MIDHQENLRFVIKQLDGRADQYTTQQYSLHGFLEALGLSNIPQVLSSLASEAYSRNGDIDLNSPIPEWGDITLQQLMDFLDLYKPEVLPPFYGTRVDGNGFLQLLFNYDDSSVFRILGSTHMINVGKDRLQAKNGK